MKIILSNKFYYYRGGDCIYTINLEKLLKDHGHEVAIFSMDYKENLQSPWSKYFPSEIKFNIGIGIFESFARPFGTKEVTTNFENLINDFKPDIVHLNNIHSQLSPIIAKIAHQKGIKTIWTLHDCKLVCPRYDCERDGNRCEECFQNKTSCIKYKCIKGNILASIIGFYELKKWNHNILEAYTDYFIAPSQYMKETMIRGNYNANKIITLCNFIDLKKVKNPTFKKDNYYCYLGRLSKEKGIETLLSVASTINYPIKIIGGGILEYKLRELYKNNKNIEFLGQLEWNTIKPIIEKSKFTVLPSECAENNPLSVIESQCLGTPVLGARIGGIPELIDEGINGITFESRNKKDLKNKIKIMIQSTFDYESLAIKAQEKYNAEEYYNKLITIYNS